MDEEREDELLGEYGNASEKERAMLIAIRKYMIREGNMDKKRLIESMGYTNLDDPFMAVVRSKHKDRLAHKYRKEMNRESILILVEEGYLREEEIAVCTSCGKRIYRLMMNEDMPCTECIETRNKKRKIIE